MAYKVLPIAGDIVGGTQGYVDSADPLSAKFSNPLDVEFSPDGELMYIADFGNRCIRLMTMSGTYPVSTLVSLWPRQPYSIDVHPTSGNLYVTAYLSGTWSELLRISPAGAVTVLKTGSAFHYDRIVVDAAETYVYVKEHVTEFTCGWRLYDIGSMAQQDETPDALNDGAFPGVSGLMRTTEPGVYLGWRDYIYPYNTGAFLRRSKYQGGLVSLGVTFPGLYPNMFSYATRRLTPAPSYWMTGTGRQGVVALTDGLVLRYDYDPDPDAFWLDTRGYLLDENLFPRVPSELLCSHAQTDQLFASTTVAWSATISPTPPTVGADGSRYSVPLNCIVTYAPNDTLESSTF
jgi:DNA-binding beta-propeller fold protein YncE